MVKEIQVLDGMPVIFTKDREWLENIHPAAEPGSIVVLPEDAVLCLPPLQYTQAVDFPPMVVRPSEHQTAKPGASSDD